MFSWVLEFLAVVKKVQSKVQEERTKKIKGKVKDEALKGSDSVIEANAKVKNSENVIEEEKKNKKLKRQKILIDVLKFVAELFEFSIIGTLIFIGILIFFVALVVILIMFILYGFLTNTGIIPDGSIYTPDDDCIPSSQVLSQNKLSDLNLGTLQGTLTPYQQNLFKLFTLYEEFIYGNGTDYPLMRDLPPDVGYKVYRGTCACETGFEFWSGPNDTGHDILKDMCVTNTSTNYVGPFAMDRSFSLLTDELLQGHKWGSDKDSNKKYVEAWKNKYPKPSGDLDQYWTPYGAAMTVLFSTSNGTYGGLNTSSNKYAAFEAYTKQRIADFGIVAKSEECYQYIRAFLSLSCFLEGNNVVTLDYQVDNNRATKHGGKARIDFLCALFAASSDDDSKRDFNNYSIILNEDTKFSYSAFSGSILEWIYTDCTGNPFNNTSIPLDALSFSGNPRIKVGDMELTVPLVRYVYEKYNELYPQGIENMDDTWYHLKNSSGQAKAAYWYGFAALLQGNHIEAEFGISMPLTSGGSIDNCDCYEGGTSGGGYAGNIDISNIQTGVPQGPWSTKTLEYLNSQSNDIKKLYGQATAILKPDEKITNLGMSYEEWRQSTKWKVPYYQQIGTCVETGNWAINSKVPGLDYSIATYGCHLFMHSYITSALTGTVIVPTELFLAGDYVKGLSQWEIGQNGGSDVYKIYNDLGLKCVVVWCGAVTGDVDEATSYFGLTRNDFASKSSETVQKCVDSVLSKNGLIGMAGGTRYFTGTDGTNHYVTIFDKKADGYQITGWNTRGTGGVYPGASWNPKIKKTTSGDVYNWDFVYAGMTSHIYDRNYDHQRIYVWNPNLTTVSGSVGNTTQTQTQTFTGSVVQDDGSNPALTEYHNNYFTIKPGEVAVIPTGADDINYTDTSARSYMPWDSIKDPTSWQYKFIQAVGGKQYDKYGLGMVNGRYVVAVVSHVGVAGDYIDVYQEDGTVIPCIVGDSKSFDDWTYRFAQLGNKTLPNGKLLSYGHLSTMKRYDPAKGKPPSTKGFPEEEPYGNPNCPVTNVIEHIVSKNVDFSTAMADLGFNKNISKIVNLGSYFINPNFSGSSSSVEKITDFKDFLFIGDSLTNQMNYNMNLVSEGADVVAEGNINVSDWNTKYFTNLENLPTDLRPLEGVGYSISVTHSLSELKGVVAMLGSNGFDSNTYKTVLTELLNKVSCNIYVQSIPPCTTAYNKFGLTAKDYNAKVDAYNSEIKTFCDTNSRLYYIETFSNLKTGDGYLDSQYAQDSIHLKKSGYEKQYQNILNAINSLAAVSNTTSSVDCITDQSQSIVSGGFNESPGQFQGSLGDLTSALDSVDTSIQTGVDIDKVKTLLKYVGTAPKQEQSATYAYSVDKWKTLNGKGFIRYAQWDGYEDWANSAYNTSGTTYWGAGCGSYATAGVLSTLSGKYINPIEVTAAVATYWNRHDSFPQHIQDKTGLTGKSNLILSGGVFYYFGLAAVIEEYGYKVEIGGSKDTIDKSKVDDCLDNNGFVIFVSNNKLNNRYTPNSGHYVVIREKTDSGYLIYSSTHWGQAERPTDINLVNTWDEISILAKPIQLIYVKP